MASMRGTSAFWSFFFVIESKKIQNKMASVAMRKMYMPHSYNHEKPERLARALFTQFAS